MVCQKGLPLVQYDLAPIRLVLCSSSTSPLTARTASCDSSWYRPGERQGNKMSGRVDGCGYLDAKLGIQRLPLLKPEEKGKVRMYVANCKLKPGKAAKREKSFAQQKIALLVV